MSALYQHPIRTDIPLTIAYPNSGPAESYAQLHAKGCNHSMRRYYREPLDFGSDSDYSEDDFFMVAPCAKATRATIAAAKAAEAETALQ